MEELDEIKEDVGDLAFSLDGTKKDSQDNFDKINKITECAKCQDFKEFQRCISKIK